MPRKGRDLEKLIAVLEKSLSKDPTRTVTSPFFVKDRVTNDKREHDVGIVFKDGHREILTALECRDRSRKVTVNEVEAFATKCADTRVDRCGIVSSNGFSANALSKAKHLKVECYTLEEVESLAWMLGGSMGHFTREIVHNEWLLIPQMDILPKPKRFHIEDKEGNLEDDVSLNRAVHSELSNIEKYPFTHLEAGLHELRIQFPMSHLLLVDEETGNKIPLKHGNVTVTVKVIEQRVFPSHVIYRDNETNQTITEAALFPIDGGGISGELIFVKAADSLNLWFKP